ncbi:MAG: 4Fe-4S dicluster domain-containing protein, partial [Planctomycetota bacterium]
MTGTRLVVEPCAVNALIVALIERGYVVVGPTMGDDAIVYEEITGSADLPVGWQDEQAPGHYRLTRRKDAALFAYTVGPHGWKRFLYPSEQRLWRMTRDLDGFHYQPEPAPPRYALFGVRACELRALDLLDRALGHGGDDSADQATTADPLYRQRRSQAFIVAVNCTRSGGTCFCAAQGDGPACRSGFDLALTELIDEQRHEFVLEIGSARGAELCADLAFDGARPAQEADCDRANERIAAAAAAQAQTPTGAFDPSGVREALRDHPDHPYWQTVADRCLACANCTLVCPTCFCTDLSDTADLSGEHAERWRSWGSCF